MLGFKAAQQVTLRDSSSMSTAGHLHICYGKLGNIGLSKDVKNATTMATRSLLHD